MKNFSSAIVVIALVGGGWASASAQSAITLLAVGPMRAPTQKIVASFEAKTGHKVNVTYGNGAETRRTVAKGQPLDVSLIIAPVLLAPARNVGGERQPWEVIAWQEALTGEVPVAVKVETGVTVMVPLFIKKGNSIIVNPETGEYTERVKE